MHLKKNDVFVYTTPTGVEIVGVALYAITLFDGDKFVGNKWICYAQNRLFVMMDYKEGLRNYEEPEYEGIIVDYAILPDYDRALEAHYCSQETKQ